MKVSKDKLRQIIKEEVKRVSDQEFLKEEHERIPEMVQFGRSKSGRGCHKIGGSLGSAGQRLRSIGDDQTGSMRDVLAHLAHVIESLSTAISSLGVGEDDMSATSHLQTTPADLKRVIKMIQKLER